jgi:hypothetical protein
LGVQIPQLALQQNVPGRHCAPPQVTTVGASASSAGSSAGRDAAGGGHSGQRIAQIGAPVHPMQVRSGGLHVNAGASVATDGSPAPAGDAAAGAPPGSIVRVQPLNSARAPTTSAIREIRTMVCMEPSSRLD